VRAHRRRPCPTVLLAGDSADLPELRALIATLPQDAYGQVYVEVAAPVQVEPLATPVRVAVTWLVRETPAGLHARGELLARAVDAWTAEWLPAGVRDARRIAWVGCAAAPAIADRFRTMRAQADTGSGIPAVGVEGAE
jgi:NADPH-dependent ferric siderophore reductase